MDSTVAVVALVGLLLFFSPRCTEATGSETTYAKFSGEWQDAITLPSINIPSTSNGLAIEVVFRTTSNDTSALHDQRIFELYNSQDTTEDFCVPKDNNNPSDCATRATEIQCCADCGTSVWNGKTSTTIGDPCLWRRSWTDDFVMRLTHRKYTPGDASGEKSYLVFEFLDEGQRYTSSIHSAKYGVIIEFPNFDASDYDAWHHLVVTGTGSSWRGWLDGVLSSGQFSGTPRALTSAGDITADPLSSMAFPTGKVGGAWDFSNNFHGNVGKLRFFSTELSNSDVATLFAGSSISTQELYEFNFMISASGFDQIPMQPPSWLAEETLTHYVFDPVDDAIQLPELTIGTSFTIESTFHTDLLKLSGNFYFYHLKGTDVEVLVRGFIDDQNTADEDESDKLQVRISCQDQPGSSTIYPIIPGLVSDDQWHHMTITVQCFSTVSDIRVAVDGRVYANGAYSIETASPGSENTFSSGRINSYFTGGSLRPGEVSRFNIYNTSLSYDQGYQLFSSGVTTVYPLYSWALSQASSSSNIINEVACECAKDGTVVGDVTFSHIREPASSLTTNYLTFTGNDLSTAGSIPNLALGNEAGVTFRAVFRVHETFVNIEDHDRRRIFEFADTQGTLDDTSDDIVIRLRLQWASASSQLHLRFEYLDNSRTGQSATGGTYGASIYTAPFTTASLYQWHHVVVSGGKSDGKWTIWLDGEVVSGIWGTTSAGQLFLNRPGPVSRDISQSASYTTNNIGSNYAGNSTFVGDIAMLKVYNVAINPAEASSLFDEAPSESSDLAAAASSQFILCSSDNAACDDNDDATVGDFCKHSRCLGCASGRYRNENDCVTCSTCDSGFEITTACATSQDTVCSEQQGSSGQTLSNGMLIGICIGAATALFVILFAVTYHRRHSRNKAGPSQSMFQDQPQRMIVNQSVIQPRASFAEVHNIHPSDGWETS